MGFLGCLPNRKFRTGRVRIACENENDLGPLSGLEVKIDKNKNPEDVLVDKTKRVSVSKPRETEKKRTKPPKKKGKKKRKGPTLQRARNFFLGRSKRKVAVAEPLASHDGNASHDGCNGFSTSADSSGSRNLSVYTSNTIDNKSRVANPSKQNCDGCLTLDHLPDLILDLDKAVVVGAKRPIRALKMLLTLSSTTFHKNSKKKSVRETRIDMVFKWDGGLVPVLLRFLNRCLVKSKEHTLALLVLGNLSIPHETKRRIAIDYHGANILARLLCDDPSAHLVALVLVNLTCDSYHAEEKVIANTAIEVTANESKSSNSSKSNGKTDTIRIVDCENDDEVNEQKKFPFPNRSSTLRKELLAQNENTALIESLAFALRVSTLTRDEYQERRHVIEDCNHYCGSFSGGKDGYRLSSPATTRLSILMAKDQQLRSSWQKVLPATASPEQILKQLRTNEQELQRWGSIDGILVEGGLRLAKKRYTATKGYSDKRERVQQPTSILKPGRSYDQARSVYHRLLYPPPLVDKSQQLHPETAKWCLSALRNLTKPDNLDATAAHVLIKSGIFSLVIQCITTLGTTTTSQSCSHMGVMPLEASLPPPLFPPSKLAFAGEHHNVDQKHIDNNDFLSATYGRIPSRNVNIHPQNVPNTTTSLLTKMIPTSNSPYSWESNSVQDVALSIVWNLSASSTSREYMNEPLIVKVLLMIAEYPILVARNKKRKHAPNLTQKEHETMNYQALRARMALSYLIGSQGHFGQTKLRSSASTVHANLADSSLVMSGSDVELLVELIANTMNGRGKDGGGTGGNYLPGTFDLNSVIFSLRCLLTHYSNQEKISKLLGLELNSLLINALAKYSLESSTSPMDSESAGHVVFCLYLLSNHCFQGLPFLPEMYKRQHKHTSATNASSIKEQDEDHGLAANTLVSYLRLSNIPPEGRHAANQLLLRLEYLNFEKTTDADQSKRNSRRRNLQNVVRSADLKIDYILLAKIQRVRIANRKHGSKPDPSIFHRPVLMCLKPCNWDEDYRLLFPSGSKNTNQCHKKLEWRNRSTVSTFANALVAVQQLSYGSTKVRHSFSGWIDDVAIANEIAQCAIHETPGGFYNFLWALEDSKFEKDSNNATPKSLSQRTESRQCLRGGGNVDYFSITSGAGLNSSHEPFSLMRLCFSSDSMESVFPEI